jgi:hypothetical protein
MINICILSRVRSPPARNVKRWLILESYLENVKFWFTFVVDEHCEHLTIPLPVPAIAGNTLSANTPPG